MKVKFTCISYGKAVPSGIERKTSHQRQILIYYLPKDPNTWITSVDWFSSFE
jgi:hypothetical protein